METSEWVPGVVASQALAWWSRFEPGRHDHAFAPGATRRVLGEREGGGVVMEDRVRLLGVPLMVERTTAWVSEGRVRFEGENTYATFEGEYRFLGEPDGVRVRLEAEVRLKRALRWTEPVARPVVRAILWADLRGHAKDMARDLGAL